jgi:hypothetical protein
VGRDCFRGDPIVIEGGAVLEKRPHTRDTEGGKKAGKMPASPVTGYTSTITEITP